MDAQRKIGRQDRTIRLDELKPYEFNNRNHPAEQVEQIAKSLQEFGWTNPILVDEDMSIIAGHGRYLASLKLGITEAPCVILSGMTEEKKRAYRILDNKLTEDSSWAMDNLSLEVGWLQDQGFDVAEWGLDELVEDWNDEQLEAEDDGYAGEVPSETFLKLGDLLELGQHRVLCGDFSSSDMTADFIFADPPYGINEQTDRDYTAHSRIAKGGKFNKIIGDDSTDTAYRAIQKFADIKIQVWFGANHYAHALEESPSWLVWDKRCEDKERDYNSDAELAWIKCKTKSVRVFRHKWKGLIKDSEHGVARVHPTQKPIALVAFCIQEYGQDTKTVLDPFLGSGTTLIAADQLGRICYGMEISPQYCQVILDRYIAHCLKSNKKADVKINGEVYNPVS